MINTGNAVDGVCYNSLINVYAKSKVANKSKQALDILERMEQQNAEVTCVTFSLLITACKDDEECLADVFEKCVCDHGMLDDRLISEFTQFGPQSVRDQLMSDIPKLWTINAKRGPSGPSRKQLK